MPLSNEKLLEFQKIYEKQFWIRLWEEEALRLALSLLNFWRLVLSPKKDIW